MGETRTSQPLAPSRLARWAAIVALCGLAGLFLWSSSALSSHVRPKGATPKLDSLVIDYKHCFSPTRSHGGPFSLSSCSPPVPESGNLTVGTPDANTFAANFVGSTRLDYCPSALFPGCTAPADTALKINLDDIRCTAAVAPAKCAPVPGGALDDYIGEVEVLVEIQLTDHCNVETGPAPSSCPSAGDAATVEPTSLSITVPCVATPEAPPNTHGSDCDLSTSLNAAEPGTTVAGQRMNIETSVSVRDGGPDGDVSTAPNDSFAVPGVFVP
jgi:hypothetical protein